MNVFAYLTLICFFICIGLKIYELKRQKDDEEKSNHSAPSVKANEERDSEQREGSSSPTIVSTSLYKLPEKVLVFYRICQ